MNISIVPQSLFIPPNPSILSLFPPPFPGNHWCASCNHRSASIFTFCINLRKFILFFYFGEVNLFLYSSLLVSVVHPFLWHSMVWIYYSLLSIHLTFWFPVLLSWVITNKAAVSKYLYEQCSLFPWVHT